MRRPRARIARCATTSASRKLARSALDSMYRAAAAVAAPRRRLPLATIFGHQRSRRAGRQPQPREIGEGIAALEGRADDTCRDQLLVARPPGRSAAGRTDELGDDTAPIGDADALAGLHASHVAAQVILEITNAHRRHGCNRSEEHTSELQSRGHLVCRLLLEKKKSQ